MPTPPAKIHRLAVPALAAILCFACTSTKQTTLLILHDGTKLHGDVRDTSWRDVVFVAERVSVPTPEAERPAVSLHTDARHHAPDFVDLQMMGWWIHDVTVRDRSSTADGVVYEIHRKGIRVPRSNILTIDEVEITTSSSSSTTYVVIGVVVGVGILLAGVSVLATAAAVGLANGYGAR